VADLEILLSRSATEGRSAETEREKERGKKVWYGIVEFNVSLDTV